MSASVFERITSPYERNSFGHSYSDDLLTAKSIGDSDFDGCTVRKEIVSYISQLPKTSQPRKYKASIPQY